jgi:predicted O-methyltransferase YrrM
MADISTGIPSVSPLPLWDLAHAYCEARAFHVANELDIFTRLDKKEMTSGEMAILLGLEQRPVRMLMDVCVALELLEKSDDKYRNALISSEFMVKGKPHYSGNFVSLEADSYLNWAHLGDAVRNNAPVVKETMDDEFMKFFTHAMHSTSVFSSTMLAQVVDLSGYKRLLDIGGGAGVNAIRFAEVFENLHATVLDREPVVEVAAEYISRSPAAGRISTVAESFLESLPGGHDAALLSNILHGEGPETNRELIRCVYEALDAPGIIIISDLLPREDRTGPPFSLVFALNMLIHNEAGDTYTESEIKEFLKNAGFAEMSTIRFDPAPLGVITALKKN